MKKNETIFLGLIAAAASLIVMTSVAIVLDIFLQTDGRISPEKYFYVPSFVLFAALVEESFKYLFVRKKIISSADKKSVFLRVALFGLGFSLLETGLILAGNNSGENILRHILEITVIHISTPILMAWLILSDNLSRISKLILALLGTVGFHSAYNFSSLYERPVLATAISLALLLITLAISIKNLFKASGETE